jgi:O-antigen/teichoic acid export membrane protein
MANFRWSFINVVIGSAASFIANIYLARKLGISNFGLFTFAQTIVFYVWIAVELGTTMYGTREIAKDKTSAAKIMNPLLTWRITAGLTTFILYIIILYITKMPLTEKVVLAGAGLYLLTFASYTDWVVKGLEKFQYLALGSLAASLVYLIGVLLLVRSGRNVIAASFAWSLSYLFGSVSLLYLVYRKLGIRYKVEVGLKIWFHHLKESLYFAVSASLMVFYRYLPVLFLKIFFSSYEVGLFSAANRVVTTANTMGSIVSMAFYPVFSDFFTRDKDRFRKIHKLFQGIMLSVGLLFAFVGMTFGKTIIKLLFGEQYLGTIEIFRTMVWLIPLLFLRYTYGSVLLATGFQRKHIIATSTGAVFMLVIAFLIIPGHGAIGAAWTILGAETIMIVSMSFISRFAFNKREELNHD